MSTLLKSCSLHSTQEALNMYLSSEEKNELMNILADRETFSMHLFLSRMGSSSCLRLRKSLDHHLLCSCLHEVNSFPSTCFTLLALKLQALNPQPSTSRVLVQPRLVLSMVTCSLFLGQKSHWLSFSAVWPSAHWTCLGRDCLVVLRLSLTGYEWRRSFRKEMCCVIQLTFLVKRWHRRAIKSTIFWRCHYLCSSFILSSSGFQHWNILHGREIVPLLKFISSSLLHKSFSDYVSSQWHASLCGICIIHNHMINLTEISLLIHIYRILYVIYCLSCVHVRISLRVD